MTSKKKLNQQIAFLERKLKNAQNQNQSLTEECNVGVDAIYDVIKALVSHNMGDGYFDATVREIRAANKWKAAHDTKAASRVMPKHHQYPEWINCDRCRTGTPKDEWNYLSSMCDKCSKDRSRWKCRECGDNLGLIDDLKEGHSWYGFVEYCDSCIPKEECPEDNGAFMYIPLHDTL